MKERGRRERARHLPLPRGNLTFRLGLREPAGKEGGLEGQGTEGGGWRTRGTLARVVGVCQVGARVSEEENVR